MGGKEATVVYTSGDGYGEGTGFESYDLQKPYMTLWLTYWFYKDRKPHSR